MRPEDTEMASGEVADEELAVMTLEELLSDLPENHPITKAVRTLELEAAALRERLAIYESDAPEGRKVTNAQFVEMRERLAKAREEAIEECAKVADEADGWIRNWEAKYGGKSVADAIRALSQKGADHD